MRNSLDMVWTLDMVQELVILEIPAGFILLLQKFCINWDVDFSVVAFPFPELKWQNGETR